MALTLTRRGAARLLDLALGLDRLPLTRAALADRPIDERRAEVISEEVSELDDEHAAAVEKLVIGRAAGLTSGQLRAMVRRAVLSADPKAARRRKEKALKDARVEVFPETSGTAALAGRDLPPAAVLAADKHLTALAQALKAAGIAGTLDILRARAYLHLLSGQPAATLLSACTTPGAGTPAPGTPTPGAGSPPPGAPGPHGTPGGLDAGPYFPAASGPGLSGAAWPAPGAPWPGPGGGPGRPGLRGSVNLTMPLSAWLGWTQAPGDVPGYGPVDAGDARTLADLLACRPGNQWCVTLTDPDGHPVAHACARHGPPGPSPPGAGARAGPPRSSPPGGRTSPGSPGPGPGPAATPVPDWLRGLTFTTLQTRTCTHAKRITRLPAQPLPAPSHPDPQPGLHRPRLPPPCHPLRPRPRHPVPPRRPHLRMQHPPRLPPRPPHEANPRLDHHPAPPRHPHLDHTRQPHPHHHPRPILGIALTGKSPSAFAAGQGHGHANPNHG